MGDNLTWLAGLSPWPADGFGLDRMHRLLAALGDPQRAYPAIHVVGTNGKTTATRTIEALLLAEGLSVGATVSPHVRGWSERITVDGADADLELALGRVRVSAEAVGATQFEVITAAALAEFAVRGVDVVVIEAGLGGRHDATNVLETRVVLLTNVGLEHVDVLGATREAIAVEKLAVARPGCSVVLPDDEFAVVAAPGCSITYGGARTAAELFVGHVITTEIEIRVPGRLERRPGEIRDGAHNPDGVRWLAQQLEPTDHTLVVSILGDKDVDEMLEGLSVLGSRLVATRSASDRALEPETLADRARPYFDHVEAISDPVGALRRAHELGEPVLVTGSLYLLAELAERERERTGAPKGRPCVASVNRSESRQ